MPMTQRKLQELSAEECLGLLATASVGRLVYIDDLGPVAVPVNYALAGDNVVIRVEGGTKRLAMQQATLAFEVDRIDEEERSGWSVVVRGPGHEVAAEHLAGLIRAMDGHFPAPWAFGVHNVWLEIEPRVLTGRRLGPPRVAPAPAA